ncbi:two-component system, chemotaxis family, sensor kinase CheA [Pseudooceanicola nitratireducens]|uniref:Chemotaxis protein CheA n=1 Tax=Pseudooceanicola nitratireducens TaxID=517719 RepID=A0A1I1LDG2_9RHOB|nr:chemotaxis protein CheA [Pseudooceanicola nitratireducens]SEJ61166.1 two-component system, chemotaxis family, sensor kinase CheA [Pseudooceanicola nitratireducens]SFC70542.1 two-component system, chemotaxis family, sensor kinase CheA [Pseudooceanicola nitratireducens]
MNDTNDPMAEIRASFFIECEELLEALQDGLQQMDDGSDDPETINIVFRAVHSIKGGAGAFGLEDLVRFAHRYETVLDEVRSGKLTADAEAMKVFFQAADHLSDLVRMCRDGQDIDPNGGDNLIAALNAFLGDTEEEEVTAEDFQPLGVMTLDLPDLDAPATPPEYEILFKPGQELFTTGNEPQTLLRNLAALGTAQVRCDRGDLPDLSSLAPETPYFSWNITLQAEVMEDEIREVFEFVDGLCELTITRLDDDTESPSALPDLPAVAEEPEPEPTPAAASVELAPEPAPPKPVAKPESSSDAAPPAKAAGPKSVVRVDLERIERLVNLVGELVINQAMLAQSLDQAGLSPHSDAMNGLEEFQRLTRDIQDSVMMIRAQPVKSLFQRMSRIVREASAAVKKDVRLITEGEATEVDKTVIERLADPLTHMIRNAVDHGLESTADRKEAGKETTGHVRLSAAHRSGRVIIEVSDDGGGINRDKVLGIAKSKGLVPQDASLTDGEIDNLLFLPGFSTASQVSDLSGRGVGMDVVKTSIQQLGGRIAITSERGKGTTFSISLPLTLAVLDGMVVNVAGETLVLPLNVVEETLSLGPEDVQMLRPGHNVVRVRGGFVPLYDLGIMLGYRGARDTLAGAIVLLISLEDGTRAALVIDGIQDQRQVVIKGLDDSFYRAPGIAAATILGDGQIALILDPADIIAAAGPMRHAELARPERKAVNE